MKRLFPVFVAIFFITPWLFSSAWAEVEHSEHNHSVVVDSAEISFKYVCPMHPQIIKNHAGTCPICGMDLVKQKFEHSVGSPKIKLSSAASFDGLRQGLAIRTTQVQKTTLWKYIPTFGKVVADKSRVMHVHPRTSGWISSLSVQSDGEIVKKGEVLYRIYSPEIVSAQQDLLLAKQSQKHQGQRVKSLLAAAKVRLQLLGVADSVIKVIESRNKVINDIPVYAPKSGVVESLIVKNGMYVQPNTELMKIENYATVWVVAEILPLQQAWVKKGVTASIKSVAYPNLRWESSIDYIYPSIDVNTQAMKVRLPVLNTDGKLKLNMLLDVALYAGPKRNILAIPQEAIIDDGKEKRVVIRLKDGSFKVEKVVTGMVSDNIVEIFSGVEEGDEIVISGQFLIDSESQIQTNLRRLINQNDVNSK